MSLKLGKHGLFILSELCGHRLGKVLRLQMQLVDKALQVEGIIQYLYLFT